MEDHRDHQVISIGDEPKSRVESSLREIQETINKSAFIIIQRRLNEMRRLEEMMWSLPTHTQSPTHTRSNDKNLHSCRPVASKKFPKTKDI